MWSTLKKFFGQNKGPKPQIRPMVFTDGLLSFRCDTELPLQKVYVMAPTKNGEMEVEIEVMSFDKEDLVFRGKVADEVFALDAMQLERRGEFRLSYGAKVACAEFKGGYGKTEDLSLSGIRIATANELTRGSYLNFAIHLGAPDLETLNIQCEIRWSAQKKNGSFHSGARFVGLQQSDAKKLSRFIKNKVAFSR